MNIWLLKWQYKYKLSFDRLDERNNGVVKDAMRIALTATPPAAVFGVGI